MRRALLARVVAALALACITAACTISQPAPRKTSYLLGAGVAPATAAPAPPAASRHAMVLRVNRFTVAQPADGRAMVYRLGEQRYETDYYNEFVAFPATMLTEATVRRLGAARLFRAVVPMTSNVDSRYVLEGEVGALHGDFRAGRGAQAVLAVRFLLGRDDGVAIPYDRVIERRIDLAEPSAAALAAALERALAQVLEELTGDLARIDLPAP